MKYIFILENNNINLNIKYSNDKIDYDKKEFEEYNNLIEKLKINRNLKKNIEYKEKKTKLFKENQFGRNFLFNMFGFNEKTNLYINDIKNINDISINGIDKKHKNIIIRYGENLYKNKIAKINEYDREIILQKSLIITLYNLFNLLELGGNIMFSIHNFGNDNTFNVIYLLLNFFEKIIFIDEFKVFCINYNFFNININNNLIENIFKNDCIFSIEPKNNIDKLLDYLYNIFKIYNKTYNLLLYNNEEKFLLFKYKNLKSLFLECGYMIDDVLLDLDLMFIDFFRIKINNNNKSKKITSAIRYEEGNYIYESIKKYNCKKCLEIGFANGISAVYILKNKETNLISIDPFQSTQWNNEGNKLVKKLKLNKRHKCIEKKSYEALPELLKKEGNSTFDFIFIDGWHTFDYTLVDFFYANLLLKVGGIIIIDDALHAGVSDCVKYLNKNYNFYNKLSSPVTVASYKKIKEDNREWNFHIKI
jgi:predicted O-methyltransferase YrrM